MVRVHSQVVDQISLGDSSWGVVLRDSGDRRDGYFSSSPINERVNFLEPWQS